MAVVVVIRVVMLVLVLLWIGMVVLMPAVNKSGDGSCGGGSNSVDGSSGSGGNSKSGDDVRVGLQWCGVGVCICEHTEKW